MYIDLHVHTVFSDGILTPAQAVEYASKIGLSAIGIVDHDNTNGLDEAIASAAVHGVEVVPGIELSSDEIMPDSTELHILGYYIDWKNTEFQSKLSEIRQARLARAQKIVEKLGAQGINLDLQKIIGDSKVESIGRMHIAKALLENKAVGCIPEAFDKYLGYGKCAYEPKMKLSALESISMILKVGGVPVVAHPFYGVGKDETAVQELISYGLQGIEVYHPKHKQNIRSYYESLAVKYKLVMTGGSDCHGPINERAIQIGSEKIPYNLLTELKNRKSAI